MGMYKDAKNVLTDLKRWYHLFRIDSVLSKVKTGIRNHKGNGKIKGNIDDKMKKLNDWIRNEMKK